MLGTGLKFGTVRCGEDGFHSTARARKTGQYQNQQKQRQAQRGKTESSDSSLKSKVMVSDEARNSSSDSEDSSKPSVVPFSNLEKFLESSTPLVSAQYFSKTTMRGWRTCDIEFQHYFPLSDLWESFGEWSAYGAGVSLVLEGCDSVNQYYVPFLSGIQLYGESSAMSRQVEEDSDSDSYRDSCSDGSSDNEIEKGMKFLGDHFTRQKSSRMDKLSIEDENSSLQEGFSSDDGEAKNSKGVLLFEYLEQDPPFSREPLADKISDLASRYPGLKTLRSCDLLPASWLSVAWYPIYRIPTGPTLKDLDACFLTYHSLSTPMTGSIGNSRAPTMVFPEGIDGNPKFSLTAFGMASYKFKELMWIQHGISECNLSNSLMQEAADWLRRRQVKHPDFQFFASHGMYCR